MGVYVYVYILDSMESGSQKKKKVKQSQGIFSHQARRTGILSSRRLVTVLPSTRLATEHVFKSAIRDSSNSSMKAIARLHTPPGVSLTGSLVLASPRHRDVPCLHVKKVRRVLSPAYETCHFVHVCSIFGIIRHQIIPSNLSRTLSFEISNSFPLQFFPPQSQPFFSLSLEGEEQERRGVGMERTLPWTSP